MQFGNDKSRIIRGLAIILMVTGHSCPGKIIPFAVPLFSFLVGYGYEFAKTRDLRHAAKRIWHLLAHFWFILLGICLPIAIFYTHYKVSVEQVVMNMFGLWGGLNYYCWYINFYIMAMLSMPFISRVIDRYGWRGLMPMLLCSGGAYWALVTFPQMPYYSFASRFIRYFQFMPIVMAAYWLAHYKVFSHLDIKPGKKILIASVVAIVVLYIFRGIPYAKIADFAVVPLFAASVALLCDSAEAFSITVSKVYGWVKIALTDLGIKSMHIWFLHALFFTASTKTLFKFMTPVLGNPVVRVLVILLASWFLSVCTMKLYSLLSGSVSRLHGIIKTRLRLV